MPASAFSQNSKFVDQRAASEFLYCAVHLLVAGEPIDEVPDSDRSARPAAWAHRYALDDYEFELDNPGKG
jgi:hypothetical protein